MGGVLGGGQGQHLSIKEGALREPVLTCRIVVDGRKGEEKGFLCEMNRLGKTGPTKITSSLRGRRSEERWVGPGDCSVLIRGFGGLAWTSR